MLVKVLEQMEEAKRADISKSNESPNIIKLMEINNDTLKNIRAPQLHELD